MSRLVDSEVQGFSGGSLEEGDGFGSEYVGDITSYLGRQFCTGVSDV